MTDHLLLRAACSQLHYKLSERLENEWFTGDEYDNIVWKLDRIERFKKYVELHRQFND